MDALRFALTLTVELIPLFLAISTVVYLVVEKLTPERVRAVLGGRSRWIGVPLAAGLGALTPFCSCSSVPLVNGMKMAGIPTSSLIAFLIASPLINPVAVGLLGTAVGARYAVLYTAMGVGFAMLAGVIVERWHAASAREALTAIGPASATSAAVACSSGACAPAPHRATSYAFTAAGATGAAGGGLAVLDARMAGACCVAMPVQVPPRFLVSLSAAFGKALLDLRKLWLPLVLAIAVGAVIHGYAPADLLARVAGPDQPWAIPAAALLGVPVYGSVVILLPLGTTLLAKGVGVGAVTAFLMGASGFSLPEGIMLSRILPRDLLIRVVVVFTLGIILIGYTFQALFG
ncbi:MAG TPA: permease [Gemmatimonadales bacterium]